METKKTIFTTLLGSSLAFCLTFIPQSYAVPRFAEQPIEETSGTNIQIESTIGINESSTIIQSFGRQPLFFIQNNGQIVDTVKYYEKGSRHATYFTKEGVYLSLIKQQPTQNVSHFNKVENSPERQSDHLKLCFVNANVDPQITAEGLLQTRFNYFSGNDPSKWRRDIPTYNSIRYKEIYNNIDLKIYGNERQLEYDVIVKPGGDPEVVKFKYEGANSLTVNERGDLEIMLDHGMLTQKAPYLYQMVSSQKVEVGGSFKLLADNSYTFAIDTYDTEKQLIIDPIIEYSKYIGGDGIDQSNAIDIDGDGNAYFTGYTESSYFPSALYPRNNTTYYYDAFVYKANATGIMEYFSVFGGTAIDWITGATREAGNDIAVDSAGYVHIIGSTQSTDFPITSGALQSSLAGNQITASPDAFYAVFNPQGNMAYSSYFGGTNVDQGTAIAVDDSGNAYLAGSTRPFHYSIPSNFPVVNALQSTYGGDINPSDSSYPPDGFIAKIHFDVDTPANTSVVFSTYFGADDTESISGLVLDNTDNIYITGGTRSVNLPGASTSTIQPTLAGGIDAFVTKINAAADAIVYSTYLGGRFTDYATAIDVDSVGSAYLTGYITSPGTDYNFPLVNPIQTETAGEHVVFVTKINANGSSIDYSTILGGDSSDRGLDIAVDSNYTAYVVGFTGSADFPVYNPINGYGVMQGSGDGFITRLTPSGKGFIYSTFFGGDSGDDIYAEPGLDHVLGVAADDSGNAYMTGITNSHCFPAPEYGSGSTCSSGFAGHTDAFIAKIFDGSPIPPEVISVSPSDEATDVSVDTSLTATFSKTMNSGTYEGNFLLLQDMTTISGSISVNATNTVTFTPSAPLATDTTYSAILTTDIEASGGGNLYSDYIWRFTTESPLPDLEPPTILHTNPATVNDSDPASILVWDAPVDTVVTVTFSEDMNLSTITKDSFYLYYWNSTGGTAFLVDGVVSYAPATQTATFTPESDLPYQSLISIFVENTVEDAAGNRLFVEAPPSWPPEFPSYSGPYEGNFQTPCDPVIGATIVSTTPVVSAIDVPVDTVITMTFDNDMDPATFTESNFIFYEYVAGLGYNNLTGVVSYDVPTRTVTFTPTSLLAANTQHTAVIQNVTNTEGIGIQCGSYGFSFITAENIVDTDNDGIPDNIEDTNLDGTVDASETDPNNPDSDGDGFLDGVEDANQNGIVDEGETDPRAFDSDVDGFSDFSDNCPTTANADQTDSDTDGVGNACDVCPDYDDSLDADDDGIANCIDNDDSDGDGFTDAEEVLCGSDPADSNSQCAAGMPWLFLLLDD